MPVLRQKICQQEFDPGPLYHAWVRSIWLNVGVGRASPISMPNAIKRNSKNEVITRGRKYETLSSVLTHQGITRHEQNE